MTLLITILVFSLAPILVAWIAYLAIDTYSDWCPIAIVGDSRSGCEHYRYRLRHQSELGAWLRRGTIGRWESLCEWGHRVTSDGSAWYHGAIIGECLHQRAVAVDSKIDSVLCSLLKPCFSAATAAITYLVSLYNGYTVSNYIDLVRGKVTHWISALCVGIVTFGVKRMNQDQIDSMLRKIARRQISDRFAEILADEAEAFAAGSTDQSTEHKARKRPSQPKDDRTTKPEPVKPSNDKPTQPKVDCTYTVTRAGHLESLNVNGDTYLIPSDRQISPDELTGLGASYRAGRGTASGLYLGSFPNGNAAIYNTKTSKVKACKSFDFDGSTKWNARNKTSNSKSSASKTSNSKTSTATVNVDGHDYSVMAPDAQPTSGYISIVVDGKMLVNSEGSVVRVKANTDKAKMWLSDPVSMLPSVLRPHVNTALCVRN